VYEARQGQRLSFTVASLYRAVLVFGQTPPGNAVGSTASPCSVIMAVAWAPRNAANVEMAVTMTAVLTPASSKTIAAPVQENTPEPNAAIAATVAEISLTSTPASTM
jgi:hypothetical protein